MEMVSKLPWKALPELLASPVAILGVKGFAQGSLALGSVYDRMYGAAAAHVAEIGCQQVDASGEQQEGPEAPTRGKALQCKSGWATILAQIEPPSHSEPFSQ
mmetsp:Transcript_105848/g.188269  ORF Transcript_105848/g.188269 Transcript_105848/m.188269 type:complete len:102 (+) Transcript_105848:292-597(+)